MAKEGYLYLPINAIRQLFLIAEITPMELEFDTLFDITR